MSVTDIEQGLSPAVGLPPAMSGAPRVYLAFRCAALEAKVQALQTMLADQERKHERQWRKATRIAHRAARSNGMCGVFDQVMQQIGMLDRYNLDAHENDCDCEECT